MWVLLVARTHNNRRVNSGMLKNVEPPQYFPACLAKEADARNSISCVCDLYTGATSEVEVNRLNKRPVRSERSGAIQTLQSKPQNVEKREEGAEAAILTVKALKRRS